MACLACLASTASPEVEVDAWREGLRGPLVVDQGLFHCALLLFCSTVSLANGGALRPPRGALNGHKGVSFLSLVV